MNKNYHLNISLFLIFVAIFSFCANAQEFKEGLIFDLKGPVKNVVFDNYSNGTNVINFSQDGKCQPSKMEFDDNGYPMQMLFEVRNNLTDNNSASKDITSYNVVYDDNRRIVSTKLDFNAGSMHWVECKTFYYEDEAVNPGAITCMEVSVSDERGSTLTKYAYSDYSYDEYGNWVSRNVCKNVSSDGGKTISSNYSENRALTYY